MRTRAKWVARVLPYALHAGVVGVVLWWLWPGVPVAFRVHVLIYVNALGAMAVQAGVASQIYRDRACALAALGALLFVVSNSIIAIDRFIAPFEYSKAVVLVSY